MLEPGLTRRTALASAAAVLAAGAVLAVLVLTLAAQRRSNERVRHSELVLRTAFDLQRRVVDIETGLRGFVITHQDVYLDPARSGVRMAPRQAARLVSLSASNPAQHRRAIAIRDDVESYIKRFAAPLVSFARAAPSFARSRRVTAEGKQRIDALRGRFAAFDDAERAILDDRTRHADDSAQRAILVGVVGLAFLLALAAALGWFVARRVAAPVRRVAEAADRVAGGDLDARVPVGGAAEVARLSAAFNAMAGSLDAAQSELRERNVELESLRARDVALLDTVFAQAPVGLGVYDRDLRPVRVNDTLADHGPPTQAVRPLLRRALDENRALPDAEVVDHAAPAPGGERAWRASSYPIRLEDGAVVGVGAIVVETTQQRQAARRAAQLAALSARLSAAVRRDEVARIVVEEATSALGARSAALLLADERSGALLPAAAIGPDELGAGAAAEALHAARPVSGGRGDRTWLAAPLRGGRRALGALVLALPHTPALETERRRVLEVLLAQGAQAIERAGLYEREQHIATTLQASLLPSRLPEIEGLDLAAAYRPAGGGDEVGGDFYDVVRADDGRLLLAVGDVEGKGPEAAAITGLVRHTLRAAAVHESRPARLLARLNRAVWSEDTTRMCTVVLAALEPGERGARLAVASAGHPAPVVIRADGPPEAVAARGMLLGAEPELEPLEAELDLGPGDGLVLYTDGLLDARAPERILRVDHLLQALGAPAADASDVVERLLRLALPEAGRPRDDIAVLCARLA
jgi:serine phosphatase RsbU (regulator of sigma subunit)/CHASE3 domain sensor protein